MEQLDELTRLAAEELMKEAQAFVKKRELNPYDDNSRERKVPNRRFLKNTLRDVMFVNKSLRRNTSYKLSSAQHSSRHRYNNNSEVKVSYSKKEDNDKIKETVRNDVKGEEKN